MGVCEARGLFIVSLDSDDALANRTLEMDLRAAVLWGADIVQHRAFRVGADGRMNIFWETKLGSASNETLVRLFRRGYINWNLWTKFFSRRLYLRAIRVLGILSHQPINSWGQDKLHCAALFGLARLFVNVDYFGYFYYDVRENAFARSANPLLEIRIIDDLVQEVLLIIQRSG
jgi:hypothetical protein